MNDDIILSIVVAVAQNGVIGRDNELPWRLPKDLAYFKKVTMGHPIIMGRKTFDSIGRPLPGRHNIVVSRHPQNPQSGVVFVHSLDEALLEGEANARKNGLKEVMLIGGASLYEQALDRASRLYVTEVFASIEGDTFFPDYDVKDWLECSRESHKADAANLLDYAFAVLNRK